MGWDGAWWLRSRRGQTDKDSPWGLGKEGSSVWESSEQGEEEGRKEWKNRGGSLLSGAAHGHPTAGLGGGLAGGGRRAGWVVCGNAGGGTQKVRGWQSPKIAWSEVVGRRLVGLFCSEHRPKKSKKKKKRSVWHRALPFCCRDLRQKRVKLSGGGLVSSARVSNGRGIPSRRLPDQLSRPSSKTGCTLTSPPPQHCDAPGRAAQNERMWEQGAWLLAQDMLGFQWLETSDQSAEAQQVLELLISGDSESGEDRSRAHGSANLQRSGDGAKKLAGARAWTAWAGS